MTTDTQRGSRLSLDGLPSNWEDWALELIRNSGIHAPSPHTLVLNWWLEFHDYWVAVPGKDGRKTDWLATWRNCCRRNIGHELRRRPVYGAYNQQQPTVHGIGAAASARARDSGRTH